MLRPMTPMTSEGVKMRDIAYIRLLGVVVTSAIQILASWGYVQGPLRLLGICVSLTG